MVNKSLTKDVQVLPECQYYTRFSIAVRAKKKSPDKDRDTKTPVELSERLRAYDVRSDYNSNAISSVV